MRKVLIVFLVVALAVSMMVAACGEEEKPTIKLSDLNWGSAHFGSEVAKVIIEEGFGYPVELVGGKTIGLLQGLRTAEIDVMLEGWLPNQQEAYDEAIAAGDIVLLGILNNDNWQSLFVVPTYVIEGDAARGIEAVAPDMKSVFDLDQAQYKELFKNPENPGKGMILTCIPGWECEKINMAKLAAYGLDDDYDLVSPGSGEALAAAIKGAYDKGDPILAYYWGPTWLSGLYDLTLLEEPPYDEAVWNENNGCAYPSCDLFVAGHKDFPSKAPEVAEMFRKWKMDSATLAEALAYMQETGGEPADAALWFLKNRENLWTGFVPADVAQKVKDAVAGM